MTRTVLVADIGKSTTRIALCEGAVEHAAAVGQGVHGLAAVQGAADVITRIREVAGELDSAPFDAISIGVAGALSAPGAAADLAERIATLWQVPACVTSDVVSAHLGALDGGVGTILVAGTGAAAFGVFDDGHTRLADGLGPDLGDHGSGYWIGRTGMRAALRARDGSAGTALTVRWDEMTEHSEPISWLASQHPPVAAIARFAPFVLDAANLGDDVARTIVDDAIEALTTTVCAASNAGSSVAVLGGLAKHDGFRQRLDDALRAAGRRPCVPLGSAMAGAVLAARRTDLPHERLIHRAG